MKYQFNASKNYCTFLLAAMLLVGCTAEEASSASVQSSSSIASVSTAPVTKSREFDYKVDPESLALTLSVGESTLSVATAMQTRAVAGLKEENGTTSWVYPDEQVTVTVEPVQDFLSVSITANTEQDTAFTWPQVSASEYYLPLGEGKRVPADDPVWGEYLDGKEFLVMEQFSMPFLATSMGDYAVVYIMEDPYRTQVNFAVGDGISLNVSHEYPQISANRTKRFRIYVTPNNPVAVAKTYRSYVAEKGRLITLEQKSKATPDIKKLYGAPFIYLWGSFAVSSSDIQWNAFRQSIDSPVMDYLLTFATTQENGAEFKNALALIRNQDYVDAYQKNIICSYISGVLAEENFWNANIFTARTAAMDNLLQKGIDNLSESEKLQLNKQAVAASLPNVFRDAATWMNDNTVTLVNDLKQSGIESAWIGLHGWEQAFAKPELVDTATEQGYLIASYDSYHSIHKPGSEQWETARFDDTTLYELATVADKSGKKIGGFQNVGRKLNPVLAMPSVKERMKNIVEKNQLSFNSWFVDCDATGEIYDDYTPEHVTTQEEDIAARMQRMAYIRDMYQMVVGSEGGNDFAADTVAFAHGIEMKSFSWMDADMNKNKDSKYYIGRYYSPSGGVAEHFAKRVPLKEEYYTLFVDPSYDLPLFKLVYNDSVITSYHWEWSTFKVQGATQQRMLREILYNVPPMYHLDADQWKEYKDDITKHTAVWSSFSRQAVLQEMTGFSYLSDDRLVQLTQYGTETSVIANFGNEAYQYQGQEIPACSALISMNGSTTIYTPAVAQDHQ